MHKEALNWAPVSGIQIMYPFKYWTPSLLDTKMPAIQMGQVFHIMTVQMLLLMFQNQLILLSQLNSLIKKKKSIGDATFTFSVKNDKIKKS